MAKGNFIDYVVSDNPNKYPDDGEQGEYYYEKVVNIETEEQTVTAGIIPIEITPSEGKLISKVNINPTPTESKSVTPTTSELTVTPSEGKHLSQVVVGAVEDVTPEVIAQIPVITQIAENLGVTITTPSGTNKQILQGNNANLENIKTNAKKSGLYVWKKLTAQGGDFIDFVVSDNESAYPDRAVHTDGYWYELVGGDNVSIKSGSVTLSSNKSSYSITNPFNSADKVISVKFNTNSGTATGAGDFFTNMVYTDKKLPIELCTLKDNYGSVTPKLDCSSVTVTDETITFNSYYYATHTYSFKAGLEYTWEVCGIE